MKEKIAAMHGNEDWLLVSYSDSGSSVKRLLAKRDKNTPSTNSSRITKFPGDLEKCLTDMLEELRSVLLSNDWYTELIAHRTFGCLVAASATLEGKTKN